MDQNVVVFLKQPSWTISGIINYQKYILWITCFVNFIFLLSLSVLCTLVWVFHSLCSFRCLSGIVCIGLGNNCTKTFSKKVHWFSIIKRRILFFNGKNIVRLSKNLISKVLMNTKMSIYASCSFTYIVNLENSYGCLSVLLWKKTWRQLLK